MSALSFYRPEFLWGLLFLAGALLVHLLRRPRVRTLEFSTLRFFRGSAITAARMRRLRKVLLLCARLLAVGALVALFAQPFDRRDGLSMLRDPHLTLFTWVDATPSMGYTSGGASIESRAGALIDSVRKHSASTMRHFHYSEPRREFLPYDGAVPRAVRPGPSGVERAFRAFAAVNAGYSLPCLMLFSDFQRGTAAAVDSLLRSLPAGPPVVCVAMPPRDPWNFSLRNAGFHEAESGPTVTVTAAAAGARIDSGEIAVAMSGISAGRKRVSVRPGDTAAAGVAVANALGSPGGAVSLSAPDPLPFDNTDYFICQDRRAAGVVVVGDKERNFPVAAAFSAAGGGRWKNVALQDGNEVTFDGLDSADVIVVNALARPSRPLESALLNRSSGAKVVIVALGADDDSFGAGASLLERVCRSSRPLSLRKSDAPLAITLPDTISELWRSFPKLQTREAAVYRYVENIPGDALLRLDNGAPLITHLTDAFGRSWVVAATPLGVSDANNLCETGFFVPCLDRVVRFAAGALAAGPDAWIAGAEHRNPFYGTGASAGVFDESGKFLEQWQSQTNVLFKNPGIYRIAPEGRALFWVAVRSDPEESRLDYTLPSLQGVAKRNILILHENELNEALRGRGRLLSYLPWILLALFLLAEIFLWEGGSLPPAAKP